MIALVLLLLHQPLGGVAAPVSCYNDDGGAVDWFYLYKLPRGRSHGEGLKYLFMERGSEGWTEGKGLVNDSTGALAKTLGPLYEDNELAYILYNDQPPKTQTDAKDEEVGSGHTKGVVLFDQTQGFWLVHSTPLFPPAKSKGPYSYPSSGMINGQNFLCVTYPLEHFQTIGDQLQINQPRVYDCHIPASLASSVPSLQELCRQNQRENASVSTHHSHISSANRSIALTSLAGTQFISFAKGADFQNDLYHSWVAPTLQSDLLVQFWRRTRGVLPSDCTLGWKVLDIQLVSPGQGYTYRATQDHSKWAVSPNAAAWGGAGSGSGWVCVGDINRDRAEERRGGGTVCLQDPVVWKAYRAAALRCYSCKGVVSDCGTAVREMELQGQTTGH
ncbi:deoxyribonuclease-2-alpha isoform X2 [Denticeps clupeoides]|uniref:Deoxyribonuclease-2-alpha n=2 Tax=Denticeps clupeoides TaxID=299321 RepID=A0AAY4AME5_9TELE|nr:deoxyribonuclease-2-alpha-like isoform X2 [Denticeps clupeoides]